MRKGHQVTFAQPVNVTYAGEVPLPVNLVRPEPEPAVTHQAGPGLSAAHAHCRLLLRSDPESARMARDFTATTLRGWQLDDVIFEAGLIATELVTNAIRHGAGGPGIEPGIVQ